MIELLVGEVGEGFDVGELDGSDAAAGLGDEGAERIGEIAGVGEGTVFEVAMDEAGGEGVAGADGVDDFYFVARALGEFVFVVGGDDALFAEGDDTGFEVPVFDGGGREVGESVRKPKHARENFAFVFV